MPSCDEMKKGQIYVCNEGGLEIQVVNECDTCHESADCGCPCSFTCCDKEPALKEAV